MLARELRRLSRNMLIYGGGDVVVRFMSFLLLPLFTRFLSPSDYGVRGLLLAALSMFVPVFSLGLSGAIGPVYFEGNNLERKARTIWTAFSILAISATLMLLSGLLFSSRICDWLLGSPKYTTLLNLTLWTTVLTILAEPLNSYLRFEERAKTVVSIAVLSALTNITTAFVLVVVLRKGVFGLILAGLIGRAITLVLMFVPTALALSFRWDGRIVRSLLVMGIPLMPSFIFLYVIQQTGKYVLQKGEGLDAVGLYQIGLSIGLFVGVAISAFQSAWYPFFMSFLDRQEEARVLFGRVLTYYVLGFGSLVLLFFVFARPVVMIMTQSSFHEAYRVVGWAALAEFLRGLFLVLLPAVYFARELKVVTGVSAIAAAGTVGLTLLLVPAFGMVGAALGFVLGCALLPVLLQVWNWHRRKVYLRVEFEWRRILPFALVGGIMAIALAWPRHCSLRVEFLLSGAFVLLMGVMVFIVLTPRERHLLLHPRSLLSGGVGAQSQGGGS